MTFNGAAVLSIPIMLLLGDELFSSYDARTFLPAILILIFTATYSYTAVQSYFAKRPKATAAKPPEVPFLVPFLGNTYLFVSYPVGFLTDIWYVFSRGGHPLAMFNAHA